MSQVVCRCEQVWAAGISCWPSVARAESSRSRQQLLLVVVIVVVTCTLQRQPHKWRTPANDKSFAFQMLGNLFERRNSGGFATIIHLVPSCKSQHIRPLALFACGSLHYYVTNAVDFLLCLGVDTAKSETVKRAWNKWENITIG